MPPGEDLREERAVRVAVQVHLAQVQRPDHGGEVVGGVGAAVQVGVVAELLAALGRRRRVRRDEVLQRRAVDGLGPPGPALVDDQEVALAQQRPVHVVVRLRAAGRAVAGTALVRHDGAQQRLGRVAGRDEREPDADRAGHGAGRVPGPVQVPAVRAGDDRARPQQQRPDVDRHPGRGMRVHRGRDGSGGGRGEQTGAEDRGDDGRAEQGGLAHPATVTGAGAPGPSFGSA